MVIKMKFESYFDSFLRDTVNLDETRISKLDGRVKTVTDFLKNKYSRYKKYDQQGSYAHKTIIKPVQSNDEFDADLLVFINDKEFSCNTFRDYVKEIFDIFKDDGTYNDKVKLNTRCVTIDYAGDFHLDIVPCIEQDGNFYICNRKNKRYEVTDGEGYKQWLLKKNKIVEGNNFRKTTRILKYLRDHKDNFLVKSILLTTLLGYQVDSSSDDFSDLPTTLKTLSNKLNKFLQKNQHMPIIKNPALPKEDFNRHWDEDKYANFRNKFNSYNTNINDAYNENDHGKSVKKWRKLFGDNFGKLKDEGNNQTKTTAVRTAAVVPAIIPVVAATKPYAGPMPNTQDNGHHIKYSPTEFDKVQECFPHLKYNKRSNCIEGTLVFDAHYIKRNCSQWKIEQCQPDDDCIHGSYEIKITFGDNQHPQVFETGDKIKNLAKERNKSLADLHLYLENESCCLGMYSSPDLTLTQFVLHRVYPYFVWQGYFEKYNQIPPCGEYPHDLDKAKKERLIDIKELKVNDICHCGSGKKYKKCCKP